MKDIVSLVKENLSNQKAIFQSLEKDGAISLKLYKYYGPTENSYNNLVNNVIHLSRPSAFNDPFDCTIGFSIEKVVDKLVEQEIVNQLQNGLLNPYQKSWIKKFISSRINKDKKNYSSKLFGYLISLKKKISKDSALQEQDLIPFTKAIASDKELIQNFEDVISLMGDKNELSIQNVANEAMNNKVNYELKDLINNHIDSFNDGINFMKALYDSKSLYEIIDICAKYGYEDMIKMQESIKNFKEKSEILLEKLKEAIDKNFYMVCFSQTYDNILMWSHYAKKHTGFCVEYDFSRSSQKSIYSLLSPVIYSNKRPSLSDEIIKCFSEDGKLIADENMLYKMYLSLLTKSDLWKYEQEWRLIILSNRDDEYPNNNIVDPIISKVYLGARISKEDEKRVLEIANKKGVEVKKLELDEEKYSLHLKKNL